MIAFRLVTAIVLLVVASACGSTPSSHGSTQSPGATPSEALFAVVEGRSVATQPGTVAILGLDGKARATATFQPRVGPVIPDAYTPLQGVAQVVGSGVYYIDGAGVVRVLTAAGGPRVVATFPLQPAQEDTWFAVSPDGSNIVAGIVTFPALGPIIPGTGWNTLVGPTRFDLESAQAGGQTKTLVHQEAPEGSLPTPLFPVGWTSAGSVVMVPQYLISQNIWPGGSLFVIDAQGKQTQRVGGPDCTAASITANGYIPCTTAGGTGLSVRTQAGELVWTSRLDVFGAWSVHVSPDGQAVLNDAQVETHAGGLIAMPSGFRLQGWLNASTVVGRVQNENGDEGNLLWIDLAHPSTVHDLGLQADFVAKVS